VEELNSVEMRKLINKISVKDLQRVMDYYKNYAVMKREVMESLEKNSVNNLTVYEAIQIAAALKQSLCVEALYNVFKDAS